MTKRMGCRKRIASGLLTAVLIVGQQRAGPSCSLLASAASDEVRHVHHALMPQEVFWRKESFPDPLLEPAACRTKISGSLLCDPDSLLEDSALEKLEQHLLKHRSFVSPSCTTLSDDQALRPDAGVVFSVALVRKMDLSPTVHRGDASPQVIAEDFARYLYKSWHSQNDEPTSQATGVLILLSVDLNLVYIARGSAWKHILTERRVSRLMQYARPLFQQGEYEAAISETIEGMMFYLSVGEPQFWEGLLENHRSSYTTIIWLAALAAFAVYTCQQQQQEIRYVGIVSHHHKLDKVHAEMLRNRYKSDSCPICLEPFSGGAHGRERKDLNHVEYLRCGHGYCSSCWRDWKAKIEREREIPLRCLICRRDARRIHLPEAPEETNREPNDFPFFCFY